MNKWIHYNQHFPFLPLICETAATLNPLGLVPDSFTRSYLNYLRASGSSPAWSFSLLWSSANQIQKETVRNETGLTSHVINAGADLGAK